MDLVAATGVIAADAPLPRQFGDFDNFMIHGDKMRAREAVATRAVG